LKESKAAIFPLVVEPMKVIVCVWFQT